MAEHEVPLEEVSEHIHHSAHEAKEKWVGLVALTTALLAALAAVTALLASHYEVESIKEHAEEFDQWALYQAKGIEKTILISKIDTLAAIKGKQEKTDDVKAVIEAANDAEKGSTEANKTGDVKTKKKTDQEKIKDYDNKRDDAEDEAYFKQDMSEVHAESHEKFALGITMFQMAIAIGAIAVLTKRRGFWFISLFFGAIGIFFLVNGLLVLREVTSIKNEHAAYVKKAEPAKESSRKKKKE